MGDAGSRISRELSSLCLGPNVANYTVNNGGSGLLACNLAALHNSGFVVRIPTSSLRSGLITDL